MHGPPKGSDGPGGTSPCTWRGTERMSQCIPVRFPVESAPPTQAAVRSARSFLEIFTVRMGQLELVSRLYWTRDALHREQVR